MLLFLLASAVAMPTEKAVQAEYARVVPLVEEVVGRAFDPVPPLRYARPGELGEVLRRETETWLGRAFPRLAPASRERLAFWQSEGMVPALLGKYALETKALYVRPRGLQEAAAAKKVTGFDELAVLDVVIAHELTHAVQDQACAAGERLQAAGAIDARMALNATFEGHAVLVAAEVARRLGHPEAVGIVERLQSIPDGPDGPDAMRLWFAYRAATTFVATVAPDPLRPWPLLAAPPLTSREVLDPPSYGHTAPPPHHDDGAWVTAAGALGIADWSWLSSDLGALDLWSVVPAGAAGREPLGRALAGGAAFSAWDDSGRSADGKVWHFADEAAAAAMSTAWHSRMEQVAAGAAHSPVPMRVTLGPASDAGFDYTVIITPSSGRPGEAHGILARRGTTVATLELMGQRPKEGTMATAVAALLTSLVAAEAPGG